MLPNKVAMAVVAIMLHAPSAIGNLNGERPVPQVFDVLTAAQGVTGFDQTTDIVIAVTPFTALRVDAFDQLAGDDLLLPAIPERVDVLVDLVKRTPVIVILAPEVVGDDGFTIFQVVLKPIFLTIATPMADYPPLVVSLRLQ
ncbi:hypothetical protein D3C80_1707090 [compost metagenome]